LESRPVVSWSAVSKFWLKLQKEINDYKSGHLDISPLLSSWQSKFRAALQVPGSFFAFFQMSLSTLDRVKSLDENFD